MAKPATIRARATGSKGSSPCGFPAGGVAAVPADIKGRMNAEDNCSESQRPARTEGARMHTASAHHGGGAGAQHRIRALGLRGTGQLRRWAAEEQGLHLTLLHIGVLEDFCPGRRGLDQRRHQCRGMPPAGRLPGCRRCRSGGLFRKRRKARSCSAAAACADLKWTCPEHVHDYQVFLVQALHELLDELLVDNVDDFILGSRASASGTHAGHPTLPWAAQGAGAAGLWRLHRWRSNSANHGPGTAGSCRPPGPDKLPAFHGMRPRPTPVICQGLASTAWISTTRSAAKGFRSWA